MLADFTDKNQAAKWSNEPKMNFKWKEARNQIYLNKQIHNIFPTDHSWYIGSFHIM